MSGTVLAAAPGPWHLVPLTGETVAVTTFELGGGAAALAPQSADATTGPDGTFHSPDLQADAWTHFTARVTADDEQAHGSVTGGGEPSLVATDVTVTAGAAAARVLPGQRLTISGTVLLPTKQPVAGTPVALQLSSVPGVQATVTADAGGHFTGSVVGVSGYYVTWSARVQDPFLSAPVVSGRWSCRASRPTAARASRCTPTPR